MTVNFRAPRSGVGVLAVVLVPGGPGRPGEVVGGAAAQGLVRLTLDACRASEVVDHCVVVTGDDEVAAAAGGAGASAFRWPAAPAAAGGGPDAAVLDVLDGWEREGHALPWATLLVQPGPAPVRADEVRAVVRCLARPDVDTCLTVTPCRSALWTRGGAGAAADGEGDGGGPRLVPGPAYHETGAVHGFRTEGFRRHRSRSFGRVELVVTDEDGALTDEAFDLAAMGRLLSLIESAPTVPAGGRDESPLLVQSPWCERPHADGLDPGHGPRAPRRQH